MYFFFEPAFSLGLEPIQIVLIALLFVWSAMIRSCFGFGGGALTLPLLLMVYPDPLFFLPILGAQLIIFATINLLKDTHSIDWVYLGKLIKVLIIPKLIGVFGLIALPIELTIVIISVIALIYSINFLRISIFK